VKKLLSLLFSIMLIGSMLTGCGEASVDQNNGPAAGNATQGEVTQNSDTKLNGSEEERLIIKSYGDNKVVISFTDEYVEKLLSDENGEKGYAVNIRFLAEDTYVMYLHVKSKIWHAYPEGVGAEAEWFCDGENPKSIEGNTISWEISREGISELLKQCNLYEAVFMEEGQENIPIAEGQIKWTEGDAQEGDAQEANDIEILAMRDDLMDIRVKNLEVVNHESQSGHIYTINFYISEADREPQKMSLQLIISKYETVYATIYTYDSTGKRSEEDILNDEGGIEVGRTIMTEYGMALQLNNSSLIDMIKQQEVYEIAENMQYAYSTGYMADAYIEVNPVIPSEFISGDEYDSWFVPITDNYKIIEIVQEDNQFGTPCWYQRMGQWVYGSEGSYFNEDVKNVYLLSFDEFGLVDSKMKVIYESETALQSDIYYNLEDYIEAEVLTGVNQPDDCLITTEFVESCDKEVFNNYAIDSSTFTYEYLGHSERVRYLSYNHSFESEIHDFFGWGTIADYSDFQYSSNEIFEGKMDNYGYSFPYRTYYCEPYPNSTILNYD